MTIVQTASCRINLPDEPPLPSTADLAVKTSWGFTLDQWRAMPEADRAYYRDNVTAAPYFNQEGNR